MVSIDEFEKVVGQLLDIDRNQRESISLIRKQLELQHTLIRLQEKRSDKLEEAIEALNQEKYQLGAE